RRSLIVPPLFDVRLKRLVERLLQLLRRLLDAAGDVVDRLSGPLRIEELLPHAFGQKHDRIDAASHLVQRFLQVEDRRPYILGIVCHGSLPMTASGSSLAPGAGNENGYSRADSLRRGIVFTRSRQRAI